MENVHGPHGQWKGVCEGGGGRVGLIERGKGGCERIVSMVCLTWMSIVTLLFSAPGAERAGNLHPLGHV